ncbi:MAG: crossover junction endodeoxyribonuclease RuvC [Fibrobacter sp.]|mgnify:CR=1 FL=1|nr:crossover junction endodeoxyribonuclease RuvC [Fibrobacter sp.]
MIILGIDPGTAITGYGVIRVKNNSVTWIDSGNIVTNSQMNLPERLEKIFDDLSAKIQQYTPQRVCIEEAFYAKNVHTTLVLGHARGVAMLAARKAGAVVTEYSPKQIKKAVTGNGSASKEQVAYMVKMLLSPPAQHEKTDAYDALAVALCDFHSAAFMCRINK